MKTGYFMGGLATGFNNGVQMGKTYQAIIRDAGLQKLRDEQMEKARKEAADRAASLVKDNQTPATGASPTAPEQTPTTPSGNAPAPVQSSELPPLPGSQSSNPNGQNFYSISDQQRMTGQTPAAQPSAATPSDQTGTTTTPPADIPQPAQQTAMATPAEAPSAGGQFWWNSNN